MENNNLLEVLTALKTILNESNNSAQASVLNDLIDSLNASDLEKFKRQINGADMWGGSGAVWEVHIEDEKAYQHFQGMIIKLVDLLEKGFFLRWFTGAKRIRRLFAKDLMTK